MKLLILFTSFLFLSGCASSANLNPNNYEESLEFITNNFETDNMSESTNTPTYLENYNKQSIGNEVTVYTNTDDQIQYIQFKGITSDETKMILDNVGLPSDEDLELLINDPKSFEEKHEQKYLSYLIDNKTRVHILAIDEEVADKLGLKGIYSVNIFYNLDIYEDFST